MSDQTAKVKTPIKAVVFRARIIFLLLMLAVFSTTGLAAYFGFSSGEINKQIISPINKTLAELAKQIESQDTSIETPRKVASVSGDLFSEFEKQPETSKESKTAPSTQTQQAPTQDSGYRSSGASSNFGAEYDAARKAQDEWWQKAQQDQAKFAQQSQAQMDAFSKQSQQSMTDFQKQSDQQVQDFLKNSAPSQTCTVINGVTICK